LTAEDNTIVALCLDSGGDLNRDLGSRVSTPHHSSPTSMPRLGNKKEH